MANKLQIKRGVKSSLPTLSAGELGYCTDTHDVYVGTGAANKLIGATLGGAKNYPSEPNDSMVYFTSQPHFEAGTTPFIEGTALTSFAKANNTTLPFSVYASTSSYGYYYSNYIPVVPGERLYSEVYVMRETGATGTAGLLYYGIMRYDKDKRAIATNNAEDYFVAYAVTIPMDGVWRKYAAHTTLLTSHTPYNGSDGGPVRYVRIILLINYDAGTIPTHFASVLLRRVAPVRDAGDVVINGNVGIGTTSPSSKLHVDIGATTSYPITLTSASNTLQMGCLNSSYAHFQTSAPYFYFYKGVTVNGTVTATAFSGTGLTVDTNTLYVDSVNHRVGICSTSPDSKLYVADSAPPSQGNVIHIRDAYATALLDSFAGIKFSSSPSTDWIIGKATVGGSGSFQIRNNSGYPKFKILSDGQAVFSKNDTTDINSGLRIVSSIAPSHYNWMIGAQQNVEAALEITPSTAVGGTTFSTPTAVFTASGNVGIGKTNPASRLDVNGTATATAFSGPLTGNVTGNLYGYKNVDNSNEITIANGFAGGTLYLNYRGASAAITGLRICSGMTSGTLTNVYAATFIGSLTGNVTGNCSGSSASCDGNAATATTASACSGNAATSTRSANTTFQLGSGGINLKGGSSFGIRNAADDGWIGVNAGSSTFTPSLDVGSTTVQGTLNIHGPNGSYVHAITSATTANRTISIPNNAGTEFLTNASSISGSLISGNISGAAATLSTTRTIWGQNFNGSANVTGNMTGVGNITGTAGITITATGSGSDIILAPATGGYVGVEKPLLASETIYIGEYENAKMTLGLTLNQGANDNEILSLKSSDVAHTCTGETEADTYGLARKVSADSGGLHIMGLSEANAGIKITAGTTSEDTTTSTSAVGCLNLNAGHIANNVLNTMQPASSDYNLLCVQDNGNTRFIVKTDGDIYYDGANQGAYDIYEDALACQDLSMNLSQQFGKVLKYNKKKLHKMGVIECHDKDVFVSTKGLNMLQLGAISELYRVCLALCNKLGIDFKTAKQLI